MLVLLVGRLRKPLASKKLLVNYSLEPVVTEALSVL